MHINTDNFWLPMQAKINMKQIVFVLYCSLSLVGYFLSGCIAYKSICFPLRDDISLHSLWLSFICRLMALHQMRAVTSI